MRVLVMAALTALASAALAAGEAQAAAFGIEMGAPLRELKILWSEGRDVYRVQPPEPDEEFDAYTVVATPTEGVCRLQAVGRRHGGDRDGMGVRMAFAQVRYSLTAQYGKSRDFDFLRVKATRRAPRQFALALMTNDRRLISYWTAEDGSALTPDVKSVTLEANARDAATTYLTLAYEFANFDQCLLRRQAADHAGQPRL